LGFELPLRISGDIKGTSGCMLMGPAGFFEMSEGVIRAMRHVHMSPDDADFYGVKAGDAMQLQMKLRNRKVQDLKRDTTGEFGPNLTGARPAQIC